ncbi:MAG: methyltransferase [Actinobacteria bacterium]|jgi:methylated-DNA-protein-cysteine methyltransferase related protein|nr:MAG: methyltransferase [Actinomycetota bacterium]
MTEFERRVLAVVDELQQGQLVSYGWVASEAGKPGAARAVGNVLGYLADDDRPWWRVVQANGQIVSPRRAEQRARLLEDGVVFRGDRVVEPPVQRP